MEKIKIVKLLIKFLFSYLAIWFIFSKVDFKNILRILSSVSIPFLAISFITFNISKIISSIRLNIFFKHLKINISEFEALKLYYIGMFYNLFLPGGIGGDGYKIYLLNKLSNKSIKSLTTVTILDRLSGLIPLLFFAGLLFLFSQYREVFEYKYILVFSDIVILTVLPFTLYIIYKYLFRDYYSLFLKTTFYGVLTQIFQLITAYLIAKAVGVNEKYLIDIIFLFLISSIVSILPITFGGIGIREFVFFYGLSLLKIESEKGVTVGIIFFLITSLSSFLGLFLNFNGNGNISNSSKRKVEDMK